MHLLKASDHFCNYCYISPIFQHAYKCCSLQVKCFGIPLASVVDKGNMLISACFSLILFLLYHCIGVHMSEMLPVIKKFFFCCFPKLSLFLWVLPQSLFPVQCSLSCIDLINSSSTKLSSFPYQVVHLQDSVLDNSNSKWARL